MDFINSPGALEMFSGELLIKDNKFREFLSMEPLSEYELLPAEVNEAFTSYTDEKFQEVLKYCSDTVLENIFLLSLKCANLSPAKNKMIKDYTGKDPYILRQELEDENVDKPAVGARTPVSGAAVAPVTNARPIRERATK
jgi:hypothetical protein